MIKDPNWTTQAELNDVLRTIVGLPIWSSHRAADLESFQIGDVKKRIDPKRGPYAVGSYALHVQSPWRITTPDRIVVGYRDLRYPRTGVSESDFDPDELGMTRREELLERFFAERPGDVVIEACAASALGDLRLGLSGGFALEVFPDTSDSHVDDDPELWRLLKHDGWHVVVSAHGIMMLD